MNTTTFNTMPATAAAKAPAKLNLTLDVCRRRDDGYHEIRSLAVGIDLCDRVCCRYRPEGGLELRCTGSAPEGNGNLAWRAAEGLARRMGREPSVAIALEKLIPVGAGLGGGSSDAATTLRLCSRLWRVAPGEPWLADLGAEIGSDVPFFFSLPAAVMTGRGERVEPIDLRWAGWALLVFVGEPIATSEVYEAWRSSDRAGRARGLDEGIRRARTADELRPLLSNDLEPAVFRVSAAVARVHKALERVGLGPWRVSGAGSTLYQLFDEREAACRTAREVEHLQLDVATSVVSAPAGPGPIVTEES